MRRARLVLRFGKGPRLRGSRLLGLRSYLVREVTWFKEKARVKQQGMLVAVP